MHTNTCYKLMSWLVLMHPDFEAEFDDFSDDVQEAILEKIRFLEEFGPMLRRPHAETLKGSYYSKMKELRLNEHGPWRVAYAFDSNRQAILLVAGSKKGADQAKFYKWLIKIADKRFSEL